MTIEAVTWEPLRIGERVPQRFARGSARYHKGRLALCGTELWRCSHQHGTAPEARRCGFTAWQALREWLRTPDEAGVSA